MTQANLTFTGPCIVTHFYSKTNQMHQYIKFILFWDDTLHISDGLSVHHQEFRTVHTATGICQTEAAVCLLARREQLASRITTFRLDPARKLSANLYDTYNCCVYSEKLLMMDRGTVRNM